MRTPDLAEVESPHRRGRSRGRPPAAGGAGPWCGRGRAARQLCGVRWVGSRGTRPCRPERRMDGRASGCRHICCTRCCNINLLHCRRSPDRKFPQITVRVRSHKWALPSIRHDEVIPYRAQKQTGL
ncbi:unnamed protein product [Urochloa humidicola]